VTRRTSAYVICRVFASIGTKPSGYGVNVDSIRDENSLGAHFLVDSEQL
jgi:hypothetical protein